MTSIFVQCPVIRVEPLKFAIALTSLARSLLVNYLLSCVNELYFVSILLLHPMMVPDAREAYSPSTSLLLAVSLSLFVETINSYFDYAGRHTRPLSVVCE